MLDQEHNDVLSGPDKKYKNTIWCSENNVLIPVCFEISLIMDNLHGAAGIYHATHLA